MYFDTHIHLDDKRFDEDREMLLREALPQAGITRAVNIGACMPSSRRSIALADEYGYIYASVGVHPHDAQHVTTACLDELKAMSAHPKVVAVGEIGLDFHYNHSPQNDQRKRFIDQLDLAVEVGKPVIIHSREAEDEVYSILAGYASRLAGGVIHCYPGDLELARKYAEMGFFIGIGGVVTYKKAASLHEVAAKLPIEHIVLETDGPYLAPEPHRGKRNDSRNLIYIAQKNADLRGISIEELAEITASNASHLYKLSS